MFKKKVTLSRLEEIPGYVCNAGLDWFERTYPDGVSLDEVFEDYKDFVDDKAMDLEYIGWYLEKGEDTPKELKDYCLQKTGMLWLEFCLSVLTWEEVFHLALEFWRKEMVRK